MNKKKIKNNNIKLFKILNDNIFLIKFTSICYNDYLVRRLREYRSKKIIPIRKVLNNFVEEYKIITWDDRDNKVIKLDLLSNVKENE